MIRFSTSNGGNPARNMIFALVMLLFCQTLSSSHASAHIGGHCGDGVDGIVLAEHTHGEADFRASHHGVIDAVQSHEHDDFANGVAPNQDDHQMECCGWLCTAAVCALSAPMSSHIDERESLTPIAGKAPLSLRRFGIDRPPRYSLKSI